MTALGYALGIVGGIPLYLAVMWGLGSLLQRTGQDYRKSARVIEAADLYNAANGRKP